MQMTTSMICVSIMYKDVPDTKFDYDYYINTHVPECLNKFKAYGMVKFEVDRGMAGRGPTLDAPFACIGRLYFDTYEHFLAAMKAYGRDAFGDIPNYTDIRPKVQISRALIVDQEI
jgi:uncharacterized protein (TIGR02118 family)